MLLKCKVLAYKNTAAYKRLPLKKKTAAYKSVYKSKLYLMQKSKMLVMI